MSQETKLSLTSAIFININIILGAGIFINTVELAKHTGSLGGFLYLAMGLVMLPLVLSLATLSKKHPGGTFYTFGSKELSPFAGFLSSWSYFTGKLGSSTIMIHASILLLQQFIPALAAVSPFLLDGIALTSFIALNMFNMQTGSKIQTYFLIFKIIPILFAILAGAYLFQGANIAPAHLLWSGIPSSIPLLIYGTIGFEAAISLSKNIQNAEKNGPRAILISYGIVIVMAALYQTLFYGALGTSLLHAHDYRDAFPALLHKFLPAAPLLQTKLTGLFHIAIASSALGGSYGILFSNGWNFYALAKNKHTFLPKLFTRFNRFAIPYACILVEGFLCALYLFVTKGKQVPLQQLGAIGVTFSYGMSVIALLAGRFNNNSSWQQKILPFLGLASFGFLLSACVHSFIATGIATFLIFVALMLIGISMFFITRKAA